MTPRLSVFAVVFVLASAPPVFAETFPLVFKKAEATVVPKLMVSIPGAITELEAAKGEEIVIVDYEFDKLPVQVTYTINPEEIGIRGEGIEGDVFLADCPRRARCAPVFTPGREIGYRIAMAKKPISCHRAYRIPKGLKTLTAYYKKKSRVLTIKRVEALPQLKDLVKVRVLNSRLFKTIKQPVPDRLLAGATVESAATDSPFLAVEIEVVLDKEAIRGVRYLRGDGPDIAAGWLALVPDKGAPREPFHDGRPLSSTGLGSFRCKKGPGGFLPQRKRLAFLVPKGTKTFQILLRGQLVARGEVGGD